jgi:hypothetical protein
LQKAYNPARVAKSDSSTSHTAEEGTFCESETRLKVPTLREKHTTVFPRQGKFALDPAVIAANPAADVTVECIGDLLAMNLPTLLGSEMQSIAR